MTILQKINYRRFGALAIGIAGLLATSVAVANQGWGGSDDRGDRYRDRKQEEPRFTDKGDYLLAKAQIHNLQRSRDVHVELSGRAKAEIECRSKNRGGHGWGGAPSRDFTREVWLELDDIERYSRHEIRGDSLYIDITTDRARNELNRYWDGYGCSGRDWDRKIGAVFFESATLKVTQGGRTVVHWECDFNRLTRNGDVPRQNVRCYRHY